MALSLSQTAALASILKPGMRVCSFGYPDVIAPAHIIYEMLGKDKTYDLRFRKDSNEICKRHGLKERLIPDAHSMFEQLGCWLDVFDIVTERGCEIPCDLNHPFEETLNETYDVVLDVGTAEHVINIWQALVNMASVVKVGGRILHENPHSGWGNHGFYSLHPTLFADFYTANGFELLDCRLVDREGASWNVSHTKRFSTIGGDVNVFALARRIEVKSFVFPQQTKYKSLIPAAGVSGDAAAEQQRAKEKVNV